MLNMHAKMHLCIAKAKNCYNQLKAHGDPRFVLPESVDFFCFRVLLKDSKYSISISFPLDMMIGNYETALIKNNELVYKSEWGYHDIKRFMSFSELLQELSFIYEKTRIDASMP
jgi:hypothetical protein